jgi:hypothetical protein
LNFTNASKSLAKAHKSPLFLASFDVLNQRVMAILSNKRKKTSTEMHNRDRVLLILSEKGIWDRKLSKGEKKHKF